MAVSVGGRDLCCLLPVACTQAEVAGMVCNIPKIGVGRLVWCTGIIGMCIGYPNVLSGMSH